MNVLLNAVLLLLGKVALGVYVLYIGYSTSTYILSTGPSMESLLPALATLALAIWFAVEGVINFSKTIANRIQQKRYEEYIEGLKGELDHYQGQLRDKSITEEHKNEIIKFIHRLEVDLDKKRQALRLLKRDPFSVEFF